MLWKNSQNSAHNYNDAKKNFGFWKIPKIQPIPAKNRNAGEPKSSIYSHENCSKIFAGLVFSEFLNNDGSWFFQEPLLFKNRRYQIKKFAKFSVNLEDTETQQE